MSKVSKIKSQIDTLKIALPGHFRVVISSHLESKCYLVKRVSRKINPNTRVRDVLGTDFPDLQEALELATKYNSVHRDSVMICEVYNDLGKTIPLVI